MRKCFRNQVFFYKANIFVEFTKIQEFDLTHINLVINSLMNHQIFLPTTENYHFTLKRKISLNFVSNNIRLYIVNALKDIYYNISLDKSSIFSLA